MPIFSICKWGHFHAQNVSKNSCEMRKTLDTKATFIASCEKKNDGSVQISK